MEPFAEQGGRGYIRIFGHRYRLLEHETTGLATQRAAEINAAFESAVAERVKKEVEVFRERAALAIEEMNESTQKPMWWEYSKAIRALPAVEEAKP